MAYLTYAQYTDLFHGSEVPESEFDKLAESASDLIDAIARIPIDPEKHDMEKVARATAYQMDYLYSQGNAEAINGTSSSQKEITEKLDEYSISEKVSDNVAAKLLTFGGIPVSPLALAILRKLGLMSKWLYAGRGCPHGI